MTAIHLEDLVFLGIVTVLACFQLTIFAQKVGHARKKHKISYPAMTGSPDFERCLRAQQNCLEFFPIFLPLLWTAGIFFHQVPVAVAGLVYMYARHMYFEGYCQSVEGRLPGFRLNVLVLKALLLMVSIGIVNMLLKTYLGINIKEEYLNFY